MDIQFQFQLMKRLQQELEQEAEQVQTTSSVLCFEAEMVRIDGINLNDDLDDLITNACYLAKEQFEERIEDDVESR